MKDLKYYQKIIQDKRKQTDFRDFLREVASWKPYGFYRVDGHLTRYPKINKNIKLISQKQFDETRDSIDGLEYDFDIDFFKNFKRVFENTLLPPLLHFGKNENCDFSDCNFGGAHGAYLSTTVGIDAENILYTIFAYLNVSNVLNSMLVSTHSSNVYFGLSIQSNNHNIFYSRFIIGSNNCWFSSNLIGCSECIFCDSLENQKYCIKNKQLDKQEYFLEKEKILRDKSKFMEWYTNTKTKGNNYQSTNSTGSALSFSQNVENGHLFSRLKNGRNVILGDGGNGCEEFYDCFDVGADSSHFYANCSAGLNSSHIYCGVEQGTHITNTYYCYFLDSCHYCIGCIGLKNKSYCILNKQYSKEDWYKMADKIFFGMEQQGTLGDFFPGELNPFYFNDTMAAIVGDFTQQEVEAAGYNWRSEQIKVDIPEGSEVIKTSDLDNHQGFNDDGKWEIDLEILKKVIVDEKGNYYRIVQMEYDFLMKHALPLPEIHWMDRMKLNFGV